MSFLRKASLHDSMPSMSIVSARACLRTSGCRAARPGLSFGGPSPAVCMRVPASARGSPSSWVANFFKRGEA
eukprot:5016918-Alexandrium_andersonii.AAC.1